MLARVGKMTSGLEAQWNLAADMMGSLVEMAVRIVSIRAASRVPEGMQRTVAEPHRGCSDAD